MVYLQLFALKQVEKIAGIKFQPISPPQPEDILKAAGKDVTFVQYDHEDHWETNETARTDMIKTIVDFLEKHNPP